MHQRRSMSTYPALLEPVCRRRQLPPTPVTSLRRSSSPRILPTPPPISPIDVSRCPSAALLERRASGRILPRPPMVDVQPSQQSPVQTSPSPIVTPEPIPELPIESDAPDSPLIQRFGDFASLDHDTPDGTRSQSSSLSPSIEQVCIGTCYHDHLEGKAKWATSEKLPHNNCSLLLSSQSV
ncbi:unnamed protein product [Haemonchus placei]|uniref:Uncharacterized protein n=1 Tax=Haemonchus placei TaxID=6290 RepID=A0A0N4WH16_HAEPC|nr:unnamed protein product [Haemonchus placei]